MKNVNVTLSSFEWVDLALLWCDVLCCCCCCYCLWVAVVVVGGADAVMSTSVVEVICINWYSNWIVWNFVVWAGEIERAIVVSFDISRERLLPPYSSVSFVLHASMMLCLSQAGRGAADLMCTFFQPTIGSGAHIWQILPNVRCLQVGGSRAPASGDIRSSDRG